MAEQKEAQYEGLFRVGDKVTFQSASAGSTFVVEIASLIRGGPDKNSDIYRATMQCSRSGRIRHVVVKCILPLQDDKPISADKLQACVTEFQIGLAVRTTPGLLGFIGHSFGGSKYFAMFCMDGALPLSSLLPHLPREDAPALVRGLLEETMQPVGTLRETVRYENEMFLYLTNGDVSGSNLLIDPRRRRFVIGDWGGSKWLPLGGSSSRAACYTPGYDAPEIKFGMSSVEADLYSMTLLVLYVVFNNAKPIADHNERFEFLRKALLSVVQSDPELAFLLCDCLHSDPTKRPNPQDVIDRVVEMRKKKDGSSEGSGLEAAFASAVAECPDYAHEFTITGGESGYDSQVAPLSPQGLQYYLDKSAYTTRYSALQQELADQLNKASVQQQQEPVDVFVEEDLNEIEDFASNPSILVNQVRTETSDLNKREGEPSKATASQLELSAAEFGEKNAKEDVKTFPQSVRPNWESAPKRRKLNPPEGTETGKVLDTLAPYTWGTFMPSKSSNVATGIINVEEQLGPQRSPSNTKVGSDPPGDSEIETKDTTDEPNTPPGSQQSFAVTVRGTAGQSPSGQIQPPNCESAPTRRKLGNPEETDAGKIAESASEFGSGFFETDERADHRDSNGKATMEVDSGAHSQTKDVMNESPEPPSTPPNKAMASVAQGLCLALKSSDAAMDSLWDLVTQEVNQDVQQLPEMLETSDTNRRNFRKRIGLYAVKGSTITAQPKDFKGSKSLCTRISTACNNVMTTLLAKFATVPTQASSDYYLQGVNQYLDDVRGSGKAKGRQRAQIVD
eukprot:TRINITY_DN1858_c0_g1_i1.p1 TRINITY_DN1858_c0_g1~~TRINITY_DN1858_c0_g1_i1.p1  ORF type:complete len:791 (+),score=118.28 TRINITY_DN1858_c0_g1_i1:159-2531(+)